MDIDQVAEIFRTNMTRLARDAADRNRPRLLTAAVPAPLPFPGEGMLDDHGELPGTVHRAA